VFVARLARLRGVLDEVARSQVPGRKQTIIEGVMRQPLSAIPPYRYSIELDKQLQTSIDRESGTVTFVAALADSALARTMVNALIESVSRAYTRVMKSQAGELVDAQAARVDSAAQRVRQAGSALVSFNAANRVVATTSPLWVEQQRLQENVNIAQSVYTQAITELENARGRAMEEAPALVVLDPVPFALAPRGRGTVFIGLATFVLVALLITALVLVREAAANVYAAGDRDVLRLVSSLERVPVFGKRAVRWFVRA
jgi:capsule polysaccharide export protein KpsE/RkpR